MSDTVETNEGTTNTATATVQAGEVNAQPVETQAQGNLPVIPLPPSKLEIAINLFDTNRCLNTPEISKRWNVKESLDKNGNPVGAVWRPQTDRDIKAGLVAVGADSSKQAVAKLRAEDSQRMLKVIKTWLVSMPDDSLGLSSYRTRVNTKGERTHSVNFKELERRANELLKLAEAFGFKTVEELTEHLKKTAPPVVDIEATKTSSTAPAGKGKRG
jgi:hypothetical protein